MEMREPNMELSISIFLGGGQLIIVEAETRIGSYAMTFGETTAVPELRFPVAPVCGKLEITRSFCVIQ
jgi:hypothetical protein